MAVLVTSKAYFYYKIALKRLQSLGSSIFEFPVNSQALVNPQLSLAGAILEPKYDHENNLDNDEKDRGFLWAVPKKRVSLERRLSKRVAHSQKWAPKSNFLICNVCGHYHLSNTVCGNCYERVKLETDAMQGAIQDTLKLDPVDKEVVVLYQNESKPELKQNELLVEMAKERPPWFSKNLLSKTNEFSVKKNTNDKPSNESA